MSIQKFQKYFEEAILNIRDLKHNGNNQLFEIIKEIIPNRA